MVSGRLVAQSPAGSTASSHVGPGVSAARAPRGCPASWLVPRVPTVTGRRAVIAIVIVMALAGWWTCVQWDECRQAGLSRLYCLKHVS